MTDISYKCLQCGSVLSREPAVMQCSACGRCWPIIHDVPTYESAKYFGEISREEMEQLATSAEAEGWLTAARKRFKPSNADLYQYIVDLNRASWIPLLPIGPESVVLDVGCGLGAITHALALNYERVVAIEPVKERVRFTKARVDQEGLKNVDLIQTTLNSLPFFEETFDLIVLNGVLEWVGEWRTDRSPRQVQVEVLKDLRRMLKPNGVILIGIENRIGFESFLGRLDHSGVRFTNLMPRWLASFYLKLRRPGFYRTWLDPSEGYRTYTYTHRGYRKLLFEAGWKSVEFWWPPCGYNCPWSMYRTTSRNEIHAYFVLDRHYKNRVYGYAFRRVLREWLIVRTGLIFGMFPDFIIVGQPTVMRPPNERNSLDDSLRKILARAHSNDLHGEVETTHAGALLSVSFRNKMAIKFMTSKGAVRGFAKVANVRLPRAEVIESSFRRQQYLHEALENDQSLRGTIPSTIELIRVGNLVASMESPACGVSLDVVSLAPKYFQDTQRVKCHLELIVAWLIRVRPKLQALRAEWPRAIPREWRHLPEVPAEQGPINEVSSWVQHGDFFPGNVFVNESAWRICVIDWEHCGDGYPPLFDWFCLVTGLYYTHRPASRLPKGQTVDALSFRQTYFEASWFSELVKALTYEMCDQLGVDRSDVMLYFRQYLAVRYHQFVQAENLGLGEHGQVLYRYFFEFLMRNQENCIFRSERIVNREPGVKIKESGKPSR